MERRFIEASAAYEYHLFVARKDEKKSGAGGFIVQE